LNSPQYQKSSRHIGWDQIQDTTRFKVIGQSSRNRTVITHTRFPSSKEKAGAHSQAPTKALASINPHFFQKFMMMKGML
jgi:hypothetical protein